MTQEANKHKKEFPRKKYRAYCTTTSTVDDKPSISWSYFSVALKMRMSPNRILGKKKFAPSASSTKRGTEHDKSEWNSRSKRNWSVKGGGVVIASCMLVVLKAIGPRILASYNAEMENVGFSLTRQALHVLQRETPSGK